MKLIMMPVIVSIGVVMFAQRDKMLDLYHAAYPIDLAKAEALDSCAKNPNFDRLDSGDRAACYAKTHGAKTDGAKTDGAKTYGNVGSRALVPTPQPYYAYNPSHLPGNDVRREEANSAYLRATQPPRRPAEFATPVPHPPVHPIVPPRHHAYRHHYVRRHTAADKRATIPQ